MSSSHPFPLTRSRPVPNRSLGHTRDPFPIAPRGASEGTDGARRNGWLLT